MYTCTKTYKNIPFAHRQHKHTGYCKLVHGHNWAFKFVFGCKELDKNGFVMDFGKMKFIRSWLDEHFDHAFVYNKDDTLVGEMIASNPDAFKPYPVDSCSAEGLARHLFTVFEKTVQERTDSRVFLISVEVMEDDKNTALYENISN